MATRSGPRDAAEVRGALPPRLASLVEPLTEAAAYARAARNTSDASFEQKRDGSRVTAVDRRLDRFLRRSLEELDGGPVRSEEHRPEGPRGEMKDGWIVDPIDGTHPFTEGREGFAVHVARLPLAPSDPERRRLARALDLEPGEFQRAMGPMIATLFWGASRIAVGRRNVLYDWDLAAPELVAVEAGGTVTDLNGRTLRYGDPDPAHPGGVLSTGPGVDHDRARELLSGGPFGAGG